MAQHVLACRPLKLLSAPFELPSEPTVAAFWKKVAHLTARSRTAEGGWTGSEEVRSWNASHVQTCDRCIASRSYKACIVNDDQVSCCSCRRAKVGCDRKIKFIFDCTRTQFFPSAEVFLAVYNTRDPQKFRALKKSANKRRKAQLGHTYYTDADLPTGVKSRPLLKIFTESLDDIGSITQQLDSEHLVIPTR
ncbi:hypothetical protein C8R43DRAFT_1120223 [Mycena crocata]|nr:hypothetical protein C8R43DRAFT_1120223 [Mycena crocata]